MTIADTGPIAGPLSGGKLRALAITTDKRDPAFPDVPTLAEAGVVRHGDLAVDRPGGAGRHATPRSWPD